MRITIKGQVTIPQAIRDAAGFQPGTEVDFIIGDDGLVRVIPSDQLRAERARMAKTTMMTTTDSGKRRTRQQLRWQLAMR